MSVRKDGFIYNLCAFVGWGTMLTGTALVIFLLFAAGQKNERFALLGGIGAIIAGILIVMIVERNIFKALGTALNHFFSSF